MFFQRKIYQVKKVIFFFGKKITFFKHILTLTNISQIICYHVNIELLSKE